MNHYQRLVGQIRDYLFITILASNLAVIAVWWIGTGVLDLPVILLGPVSLLVAALTGLGAANLAARYTTRPMQLIWQAILHVSPGHTGTLAPNIDSMGKLGRELVAALTMQVYQLASGSEPKPAEKHDQPPAQNVMNKLPLPLFIVDKEQSIVFANEAAEQYIGALAGELAGQSMYSVLDLSFPSNDTFDEWLAQSREKTVTASKSWEHVRLKLPQSKDLKQLDMAAYYSKDDPSGVETIIMLFDHTERYGKDDQALSFVALAVHELRAPLTLLRGYIEVFEDELDGRLDPELQDFMDKMKASSQQLTAFISKMLNVARVDSDQLVMELNEEDWTVIVKNAASDWGLRAKIQNKSIECVVAPQIPTVGADRLSIYEVLSNLLENALKYSQSGQKVVIRSSLTKDGMIETLIEDKGIGIPESVVPNLFEKFYRSHRTQSQVIGTGLGLYLSKAIIEAHGGNIWIRSKEGQGTTVGFTLQPYVMIARKLKSSNDKGITRSAHGWIKNHSLYRR